MDDFLEDKQSLLRSIFLGNFREDNHGNLQHSAQITCSDGRVIDYPMIQRFRDIRSIDVASSYFDRVDDGHYTLNDIQSPLQTRCQQAAEAKGQGF